MKNQTARFVHGDSKLVITLSKSRNHFRVQTKMTTPDEKPQTGAKKFFELTEDKQALEQYTKDCTDAIKHGWVKKEKPVPFTSVPKPPERRAGATTPVTVTVTTPNPATVNVEKVDSKPEPAKEKRSKTK